MKLRFFLVISFLLLGCEPRMSIENPAVASAESENPTVVFDSGMTKIYRYDTTDGMACYSFSNGTTYTLSCVKK